MFNPQDLNKHQRILLAIVGVVILLIQLYKFSEDGVEGSGWILALLVASILILPSLSLIKAKSSTERKNKEKFQTFINQSQSVQVAFKRIKNKSNALKDLVSEHIQFPDIPTLSAVNETMKEELGRNCYLYVAALSAAAEFKKNPDFLSNENFVVYEAQVVRDVLNSSKQSAIKEGFGDKHDDNRVKALVIKDWNLAKTAMMGFIDNLSAGRQQADTPLMDFLFNKVEMPDMYKKSLETPLRDFTKQTLQEFAQQ